MEGLWRYFCGSLEVTRGSSLRSGGFQSDCSPAVDGSVQWKGRQNCKEHQLEVATSVESFLKQENTLFSAPAPTTAVPYTAIKCVDVRKNHHKTRWLAPWGPNKCDKIRDIEEAIPREIEANDIVFSVHIPLPSMEMSPWFQFMLFILQLDIAFKLNNQISKYPNCYGQLWNFLPRTVIDDANSDSYQLFPASCALSEPFI